MTTPAERPVPQPAPALQTALPTLERLNEELRKALGPAMNAESERRDRHGAGDGYTSCAWHLSKALLFLLQAARAAEVGDRSELHDALRGVDASARRAARYAREARAAAAVDARELATLDAEGRTASAALGDTVVEQMTATVSAGDAANPAASDRLTIGFYDDDARPGATWRGEAGPLALDGVTHLGLVAVAETLGEIYDRYPNGIAFHSELERGPEQKS